MQRSQGPQLVGFHGRGRVQPSRAYQTGALDGDSLESYDRRLGRLYETVDNWTLWPKSSGAPSARNQGGYGYAILMLQHGHD